MWFFLALLLPFGGSHSETITRYSNIKCDVLDPSYVSFKECHLKMLGRGIVGLNVHVLLLKGSFNNCKVNLSFWRRYNGFRPFMFNTTFDFCKIMEKPNIKLSFEKIFLDMLTEKSNVNHTCPYEKEIIVRKLVFKETFLRFLPLPSGEYQFQISPFIDKSWTAKVYVNFLREEGLMKN